MQDPEAYILSVNVHRRNLTPGQRAMAQAIIKPEGTRRGGRADRGKSNISDGNIDVTSSQLAKARTVLQEFGPDHDVVRQVLHGGSLAQAYEKALAV